MSPEPSTTARPPEAADNAANVRRLPWGEGRDSCANDQIPALQKQLITLHLAECGELKQAVTKESPKEPPRLEDAGGVAAAPVSIGQLYYADALAPINWARGTSTITPAFANTVMSTVAVSTVGSVVMPVSGPFQQVNIYGAFAPDSGPFPNSGGGFSVFYPLGAVWHASNFEPVALVPVIWEVGSEALILTEDVVREMESRAFLDEVYRLDASNIDAAGDFVFDRIDRMLSKGDFGLCDRILRNAEVGRLSTFALTALLNITSAAKGPELPSRDDFFSRVRARVVAVRGAEKAARILDGLE